MCDAESCSLNAAIVSVKEEGEDRTLEPPHLAPGIRVGMGRSVGVSGKVDTQYDSGEAEQAPRQVSRCSDAHRASADEQKRKPAERGRHAEPRRLELPADAPRGIGGDAGPRDLSHGIDQW